MNFFDGFLVNTVFILFPLLVYLIYVSYRNNIDKDYNDVIFQIVLFSSLYLVMRHGYLESDSYIVLLVNIPLLFAFLKHKLFIAITISIVLVFFSIYSMNGHFIILLFEYITYIFAYLLFKNKDEYYFINVFSVIKAFSISFSTFYFIDSNNEVLLNFKNIFMSVFIFYIASNVYYFLIKKGEQIVALNSSIKDLEREKAIQESLFKITHEIKNPIAVCKGYLDMLDLNDLKKVNKYIPIIRSEVNRTLVLMDDFLDYSRIKVDKDILDINLLIEDTCSSMVPLFRENKVFTKFKLRDDEVYVLGDYNRLKQVLINIFKNSFESRKNNERLNLTLDTNTNDKMINIVICDNGCGMDSDQLDRIGEAFFTTKSKGSGLGVCLSRKIISLHDGELLYESKLNEGTKVTISLPIYEVI